MAILDTLNKRLALLEDMCPIRTAEELSGKIQSYLAPKFGKNFLKISFDKSENGNGMLFIRFAKHPMEEATNEKLQECPISFIISIDGFRDDGTIDDSGMNVDMFRFQDKTNNLRKMRSQRFTNPNIVRDYLAKYFDKYSSHLCCENGEGGGAPAGAAPAMNTDGGGNIATTPGTSTDQIAVFKPKLGEPMPPMIRRNWEGKGKRKKKSSQNKLK